MCASSYIFIYVIEACGKLDIFNSNADVILGSLSPQLGLAIKKEPLLFETSSFLKVNYGNITKTNIIWKSESTPNVVCLSTQYCVFREIYESLCMNFHSVVLDGKT